MKTNEATISKIQEAMKILRKGKRNLAMEVLVSLIIELRKDL